MLYVNMFNDNILYQIDINEYEYLYRKKSEGKKM